MHSTPTPTPTLATRFARNTRVMRGDQALNEDPMRAVAPSIFAEGKHASRSERYTYIPTIVVLRGLRREGVEPFILETAVGRARVGCDGARWQGATTTRGIPPLKGATPPACASAAQSGV